MKPTTKHVSAQIAKWLTIVSAGLTAATGGLAALPGDAVNLVIPPSWRPYMIGASLIGLGLARVVVPFLDAVSKKIKENP